MVSIGIELNEQEYKKTSLGVRFLHNTRTLKTNNSIFSTEYNFTKSLIDLKNLDEVNEYFSNEEEELKKFVKEKTKQKSKNKFHIIESIISISDDEEINTLTLEEQKKLLIKKTEDYISHLKNQGIKIYQYSLHFDEGHLNENEEMKINRHIHIIHSNILESGKSFTKSLYEKNKGISKIQDLISKTFQMKRGEVESKNKHQGYKNYKRNKQQEKENNIKDELKLNTLEKENQELKKENIDFKNLLNQKDLKISTLEKTLKNMYSKLHKEEIKNKYKTTKEQITQSTLTNETKKEIHKINKKTYEEYNSPSLSLSL
mgnify:CR=1 FL=1